MNRVKKHIYFLPVNHLLVLNWAKKHIIFFSASLPFTSVEFSCKILVNLLGEKVHYFSASFLFTSIKCNNIVTVNLLKFFARNIFISTSEPF